MARKKLKRFAEIEEFPNTFYLGALTPDGDWARSFFGNERPLVLELGCGKGEYTLELARRHPERNHIGIDRKGERIWKGAKRALEEEIGNVAFLRMRIEDLDEAFSRDQVEEIWIPFPDPLPKKRQRKHRLLAPSFLSVYRRLLRPGGRVHLKTDDDEFFADVLETLDRQEVEIHEVVRDLYRDGRGEDLSEIETTFEGRHLEAGRTIKYLRFSFSERSREGGAAL